MEKSESQKVNRLKTAYLEKIVPLLKDEFSYTNIHQVTYRLHHLISFLRGLPFAIDWMDYHLWDCVTVCVPRVSNSAFVEMVVIIIILRFQKLIRLW